MKTRAEWEQRNLDLVEEAKLAKMDAVQAGMRSKMSAGNDREFIERRQGKMKLDGLTGRVNGKAWKAHGFLSLIIYDEDRKKPRTCPKCGTPCEIAYPSGYVRTLNIAIADLREVLDD